MEIKSIGDMDFDTLYDTYAEQVYQTALHYTENHHVAEEITQEVFEELLDYKEDIILENVESWLYTVARNRARNHLRDHKKEVLVESIDEEMDNIVHIEGFDTMKEKKAVEDYFVEEISKEQRSMFIEKIYDALYVKNERWYLAMMGAFVLKIPHKELAKKLGVSVACLEMTLSRAKKWIRKRYREEFDRLEKE